MKEKKKKKRRERRGGEGRGTTEREALPLATLKEQVAIAAASSQLAIMRVPVQGQSRPEGRGERRKETGFFITLLKCYMKPDLKSIPTSGLFS